MGDFTVGQVAGCWRLWTFVASLVLNEHLAVKRVLGIRSAGPIECILEVSVGLRRAC